MACSSFVRFVLCIIVIALSSSGASGSNTPQQIHLSFGSQVDQMIVTWSTFRPTAHAQVLYGPVGQPMKHVVRANSSMYENPGSEGRLVYIHRAVMSNLKPSTRYTYQVMSRRTAANPLFFTSRPEAVTAEQIKQHQVQPATFAMYADMGVNTTLVDKIASQTQRGDFLAVLHGGDIAYDLHKKNGRLGDTFMRMIQPIAGYAAYQVAAGNHERKHNFSQYQARFSMMDQQSGRRNNHYYSFDEHLVHFVVYSSEFYFYPEFGTEQIQAQYNWLKQDLKRANLPENRSRRPWIIAIAHRSMYCAGFDRKDCSHDQRLFRAHTQYPIESLFQMYGVDMHLSGHEHAYVRMLPVYSKLVFTDSVSAANPQDTAPALDYDEYVVEAEEQPHASDAHDDEDDDNSFDLDDNQTDETAQLRDFYALDRQARPGRPQVATYHNPPTVVNIVSGASSNMPLEHSPPTQAPHWVARWSLEASYTRFTVYNETYIHVQQVTGAPEGQDLLDELHLHKNIHGPILQSDLVHLNHH